MEKFCFDEKSPFKSWKYYTFWRNVLFPMVILVPMARYELNYHSFKQVNYALFYFE